MIKTLRYFAAGLLIFQIINLSGNVIRLVPEWRVMMDYAFYLLIGIAALGSIGCFIYANQKRDYFKAFVIGLLFWFQVAFFLFAFKLAWLDILLKNVES